MNDTIEYELLIYGLFSELTFSITQYAFLASVCVFVPTYIFLLKDSATKPSAALAFIWLGVGLSAIYFITFEWRNLFREKAFFWVLIDVGPGAISGFAAWSFIALTSRSTGHAQTTARTG